MIRFIDLGDQITCDGTKEFAWFDTIRYEFVECNTSYIWDNWEEFEYDLKHSTWKDEKERFKTLFQWKEKNLKGGGIK